jgi:Tfp pilus assembly protein PilO
MKLDIKKFTTLIEPAKVAFTKYKTILIIVLLVGTFGFIFYRIGYLNQVEPSETAIEEQIRDTQRPRIDKAVIDKLQNLENQNIQVKSLFNQARENPFKE